MAKTTEPKKGTKPESKKATATTVANDPHIPITPTEVIDEEVEVKALVPTMDVTKDVKNLKENPLVKAIATFQANYAGLTFVDLNDKEGIKKVQDAKKTVQKTRTWLEKQADILKAPYIKGSKLINEAVKEYNALIEVVEDPLDKEIDRLKQLQKEEAEKAAIEAEKEGTRRIDVLKEAGMKFGGMLYEVGETISMDYASIKAMPADEFEKFVAKVAAEKKRIDEAEAERLRELKENRVKSRGAMLVSIGMICNDGDYTSDLISGVRVMAECLTDETDNNFMTLVSSLSTRIADAKKKAEDEAKKKAEERILNMRSRLLISIGMEKSDWLPNSRESGYVFKNDFADVAITSTWLVTASDEDFDKQLPEFENKIAEAKQQAIDKAAKDKEREERLKYRQEQLVKIGLVPVNGEYIFKTKDVVCEYSVINAVMVDMNNESWDNLIAEATREVEIIINLEKELKEKEARDAATYQERHYQLINIGMQIVSDSFIRKNEFGDIASVTINELKLVDADVWAKRLQEITIMVNTVNDNTVSKRAEIQRKLEAAKPESDRIKAFIKSIVEMPAPEVEDDDLKAILKAFTEDLLRDASKANTLIERKLGQGK